MVEVTIHDKNLRDALIDHWEDLPEEAIDELLSTHRIEAAKAERDRLRERLLALPPSIYDGPDQYLRKADVLAAFQQENK